MPTMSPFLKAKMKDEAFEVFKKTHYFECMSMLEAFEKAAVFVYDPPVPARNDEERLLVQAVSSEHVKIIEARIAEAWAKEKASAPELFRDTLPQDPPAEFWELSLFDVVRGVVQQPSKKTMLYQNILKTPRSVLKREWAPWTNFSFPHAPVLYSRDMRRTSVTLRKTRQKIPTR